MSQYDWPTAAQRRLIGKEISRVDGPAKVSGKAAYTYDMNLPGMLYARVVRCPHAHAKVKSIDTGAAEKIAGFKAAYVIQGPGTEIFWAGDDIVAVAATDEHAAEMAARAVKVQYTILPFLVLDSNPQPPPSLAGYRKPMDPETVGNVTQGFAQSDVVIEGDYGVPVITHCCLESHGSVWPGRKIPYKCISLRRESPVLLDSCRKPGSF